MSTAMRQLKRDVTAMIVGVIIIVCSVIYFDDIKAFAYAALNLPEPLPTFVDEEDRSRSRSGGAHLRDTDDNAGDGRRTVQLSADRGGQFSTRASINGADIRVLVDTGATFVSMSYDDAAAAGIHPASDDFRYTTRTANGTAKIAVILIDEITIGGIRLRNVRGTVAEPGRLFSTLLGMSFLNRLESFQVSRGTLVMVE